MRAFFFFFLRVSLWESKESGHFCKWLNSTSLSKKERDGCPWNEHEYFLKGRQMVNTSSYLVAHKCGAAKAMRVSVKWWITCFLTFQVISSCNSCISPHYCATQKGFLVKGCSIFTQVNPPKALSKRPQTDNVLPVARMPQNTLILVLLMASIQCCPKWIC